MRLYILFLFFTCFCYADDSAYHKVRDELFWPKLYNNDYETLYCGVQRAPLQRVTVEHVYASDWIAESMGCENRKSCDNHKYREASSDLHNLWPAIRRYNSSRGPILFGELTGETPRFPEDNCDFERSTGQGAVVEPRDSVKGQIARSFLYMVHSYELPHYNLLPLMIKWHTENPVTKEEIRRNVEIIVLQGRGNPFITMRVQLTH